MELLSVLPEAAARRAKSDPEAGRVRYDSRQVAAGDVFVAIPGAKADGYDFIARAIASGAAAVVSGRAAPAGTPASVAWVTVENPRRALALLAARRA